ncbi:MAG: hypothetical protein M0C28_29610 [Candidatus Moduliflexus flocculans]|nr:hypothetical protein [Candidatus Moduliflexus flocculans]
MESLEKGRVPKGWNPKETTTLEEVTFLAPLDIVSARGRAKKLFDFEYIVGGVHARRTSGAGDITSCRSCTAMTWWRGSTRNSTARR